MTTPAAPADQTVGSPDDDSVASEAARAVRWVTASKDARDAIKWLATAIGAAAAVAFGAGPVLASTTQDISGWEWWRLVLYIVTALAGALGAAYIVWELLKALVPRALTLDQVPQEVIDRLNATPEISFPGRIDSWERFRLEFQASRRAAATYRERAALEADPNEKARFNSLADARKRDIERLRRAELTILERAGYEVTRNAIYGLKRPVFVGITVAILGVAGFQLVISGSSDEGGGSDSVPATLIKSNDGSSDTLWADLELDDCDSPAGRVPVLVTKGTGAPGDPYVVQTLGTTDACPAVIFSVTNDVATVEIPKATDKT